MRIMPYILVKRSSLMEENFPSEGFGPFDIWMIILAVLILVIPFWRIFSKAGYSGWFGLLMLIPLVNLITLYFLAFSKWPALNEKENDKKTHFPPHP